MRRKVVLGLSTWFVSVAVVACDDLSVQECDKLRAEAYEILNEAHTCNDDADCLPSDWPGCAKPLNTKNHERMAPFKEKFDAGSCTEPSDITCPDVPLMYCKQGLCVAKHEAGESGNPSQ